MACPERAAITPRPTREREGSDTGWEDQVAELIDDGLLTDDLEMALHVVAGIIAADPAGCRPRRRITELPARSAEKVRRSIVRPGSR